MLFFSQTQQANDPERRARAVDGVERGLAEAMVMLEGMAEHLRLESGTLTANCRPVPLADVLGALELELAPAARRAGIDLRIARSNAVVLADPALLTRILRNLVTNALLHSRGTRVRVLVRRRGERSAIMVLDDGVGIAADEAETLFLPYTQGADSRRLGHGSGLGLAIAREMAHLMDGGLIIEPRWTCGSAFVLDLPLDRATRRDGGHTTMEMRALSLEGRSILLVEDRADTREALAAMLQRHGAKVVGLASSHEVAAALAEGLRPAVAITDWHLGHADSGAQVVALLRTHTPEAQVLVMSGDATLATERQVAALGCALLLKPVPERALLAALAQSGPLAMTDRYTILR
jgi:CheY-like chemotaxis protein